MGKAYLIGRKSGVTLSKLKQADAVASDVLTGKGFYAGDTKEMQTGSMADKSGTTQSTTASLDTTNSRVQMTVPATGKYSTTSKLYATIRSLIGLTAAKIVKGNTILGLAGTGIGVSKLTELYNGEAYGEKTLSYTTTKAYPMLIVIAAAGDDGNDSVVNLTCSGLTIATGKHVWSSEAGCLVNYAYGFNVPSGTTITATLAKMGYVRVLGID